MATVAEAVVKLSAETANFRRDFAAARAETQSFQQSLISVGKEVVSTVAGLEALRVAKEILTSLAEAAMEVEQANARLEAVFKATGHAARLSAADVEDFATAMQDSTLFDDEDVKNAAAALATFQNVQGETFKQAIRLAADMSAVFGGDLQENVMKLGKALDDPIDGVTGLSKALGKLSPAEQEHIKSLVEHNRLADAQAVILQRLTDKVGGTAAALAGGDGLTANVNRLSDAWKELKESTGGGWIKTDLAQSFHALAIDINNITGFLNSGAESAADFTKELQRAVEVHGLPTVTVMGEGPEARKNRLKKEQDAADALRKIKKDYWAGVIADDKAAAEAQASIAKWLSDMEAQSADADAKRADDRHQQAEAELAWQNELAQMRYDEEVHKAEQVQEVWTHAVKNISDDFANTFADLLTGQIKTFRDFAQSILSIWAKTLAQMAGAKLATSLFGSLLDSGVSSIAPPSFGGFDIPNPLGSSAATIVNIHLNAIDTQSGAQFLQQQAPTIGAMVARTVSGSSAMQRLMARGP